MRITTWNVNGLRAALRKGFAETIAAIEPDVLLLQEIRSTPDQLGAWAAPDGWHVAWHPAEKKGYSGVAVWSRAPIEVLGTGLSADDPDPEGRVLAVRTGGIDVVSVYLPSGSSGAHRQAEKEAWMDRFLPWASERARAPHGMVLGGDLNIAHTEDDIWNPVSNKNNSGFLPHERAWFGELLGTGWRDVFREHFGARKGPYSWWSNRGQAAALDRGWRIDYLLANGAAPAASGVAVDRAAGTSISDHAPVTVDLG